MALERLGARVQIEAGYVHATAGKGLTGAEIHFPKVTVGGTHTALMAACLANGRTTLINAAREPEVADLAECLNKMGAKIKGAGQSVIEIEGVTSLSSAQHKVMPDRIEAGTYAMAAVMAGGDVMLEGAGSALLESALEQIGRCGAEFSETNKGLHIWRNGSQLAPVDIVTAPFPGFPTDLQAQFMALMTRAEGTSRITETIFENRFIHVQELVRLGAHIKLDGDAAVVEGVTELQGAPVMATDLRASMSLVIAALAAKGETIVHRVYHLDRGFEHIEEKLGACGAEIERLSDRG
jgi:UDP-N-acetylglucosamine 1-carboxyvinyltransferase